MTEAKKTTEKKAAPKAAVKPKTGTAPKSAAPKKETTKKAAPSGATVKLVQTGSPLGRRNDQRATLIGLGLNKLNRERVLQDTPEVRGMIYKVRHLVKVVG